MLIGRQAECERIEGLVAAASDGGGGALLLHGPAGIGKTALLGFARERAEDAGLGLLAARGVESAGDLPYQGLHDLLRPLLGEGPDPMEVLRARLPAAQATALGQALALGPEGTPARFAVPAAILGLLAAEAEDSPLLCVVDDVQWVDAASVEALVFAARRLGGDGVAILLAQRDGAGRPVDAATLPSLAVGPLGAAAAGDLLRSRHGERLAGTVATELVRTVGGHPLALVELSAALSPDQLSGREPLPPVMPEGVAVERAFQQEIAALPEETRRALAVAAASDAGEDAPVLGRALAHAGVPAWVLDSAESAGVIAFSGPRVDFRHPLLRAAAYHAATPEERRAAHRALADAHPAGAPQRAWHLAAAADGTDEEAATVLQEAAAQARERGGFASAARAETRAAELTAETDERARRLLAAARDYVEAGDPEQAAGRAEDAYALASDADLRADLEWLLGHVWMRLSRAEEAESLLLGSAERSASAEPARTAMLLLEASLARLAVGGADRALEHARRARAAGAGNPMLEALADVMAGQALLAKGAVAEGAALVEATQPFLFALDPVHAPSDLIAVGANALVWTDRYGPAREILARVIQAARDRGALARLAYPLGAQSVLDFRNGRWADAVANGEEAVRASADTGTHGISVLTGAFLAEVEGHRGLTEQAVARALEAAELGRRTRSDGFMMFPLHAAGVALLAAGRHDEAIAELERAWAWSRRIGTLGAGWLPTQPALVEAYAAAGRHDAAAAELERLEQSNAGEQTALVEALIARCRGIVTGDVEHLERALEHHARVAAPFERAQTELALGERLADQLAQRRHLRAALETFERLGAAPWAERARAALHASGVASPSEQPAVVDVLTPHELQVALVVARGATNKDAAAQLFLSPKTVEHHLGAIYRKLELRSRAELASLLAPTGEAAGAAA